LLVIAALICGARIRRRDIRDRREERGGYPHLAKAVAGQ
jgi:hypothetical protein